MTTDGGGWTLVYKLGGSTVGELPASMNTDKNIANLLSPAVTTSAGLSHFAFSRFNSLGTTWTVRTQVDCDNAGNYCQYSYYQPRSTFPETVGVAVARTDNDSNSRLQAATRYKTSAFSTLVYQNMNASDYGYVGTFYSRWAPFTGECNTA